MINRRGWIEQRPAAIGATAMIRCVRWGVLALCSLSAGTASASGGLKLAPEWPIYFSLLIGFVFLIAPLNALIFRPLFRVLDERDQRITGARVRAEQLAEQAEALTDRYRGEIRQTREESEVARREQLDAARSEQASITGSARTEAETEVARARDEITASLVEARETLRTASQDLATVAAERILGRTI